MLDTSPLSAADAVWVLERAREKLRDRLTYTQYGLVTIAIDRVIAQIDGSQDRENALDAQVKRILDSEPFKSERLRREADMILFNDAMKYADYNMHLNWEIKGFKKLGIAEPPQGCRECKAAYDTWIESTRSSSVIPRNSIQKARDDLQNMHRTYMLGLRERKPTPSISHRGSGFTEEKPQ